MRAGFPAADDSRVSRLDGDTLEARLLALDDFADSGDRPASADTRDDRIRTAAGIIPDFDGRCEAMDLGIRRVVELLRHVRIRIVLQNLFGFANGPGHSLSTGRQHKFGTEHAEQSAALDAHRFRHRQDQAITP